MPKYKIAKWRKWLKRIKREVRVAVEDDRSWQELRRMWRTNPALNIATDAVRFLERSYAASAALAFRRQMDTHRDAISLRKLLTELTATPTAVTRASYVGDARGFTRQRLSSEFDAWATAGTDHLDPNIPRAGLRRLKRASARIQAYADKVFAHADKTPPKEVLTWKKLRGGVNVLDRIVVKYVLILQGGSILGGSLVPRRQFNPELFYRRPWLGPTWETADWPPGKMRRRAGLFPFTEWLTRGQSWRVKRGMAAVVTALRGWRHELHERSSPIREALEEHGLPSTDAAVALVRDHLATLGTSWVQGAD